MNFTNFNRKYVQNNAWDVSTTLLWEHNNGTVAQIDMYWEDNYVFFSFENGPTLDIQFNGSEIKVGFHDEVRKRDLSSHPSWNTNRQLLVKFICATSSVVKQPKNNVKQSGISFQTKSSFN